MTQVDMLGYGAVAALGLALAMVSFLMALTPPAHSPRLGLRGLKRREALSRGGLFASVEPLVRFAAGLIARLPIPRLRRRLESQLTHAGDLLGLTPDEYMALSVLSALGFFLAALALRDVIGDSPAVLVLVVGTGALLPQLRVNGETQRRQRQVDRALPVAIDLAALCMGAGLDFPGALRQIIDKSLSPDEPLHEELGRILSLLELGRTRREALESFAERVPTDAVRDFVSSVVQSEEKGNPLVEVLRIQARMLRMRRSLNAEQAASRAGVMMMIPLMLIFASIILILLGPFIVNGMNSGF
ncbi:MAG TPA: type II secretion system F family protein [Kofleriaceae bacterium]|nr:type II secretion system F family protein [Kofleriaceae bacterium]